jgi:hypothetical protein
LTDLEEQHTRVQCAEGMSERHFFSGSHANGAKPGANREKSVSMVQHHGLPVRRVFPDERDTTSENGSHG